MEFYILKILRGGEKYYEKGNFIFNNVFNSYTCEFTHFLTNNLHINGENVGLFKYL